MSEDPPSYLLPEQLRVGVYVMLDLPWFKHNFAVSDFRIRTPEQLREVLDLRLPRYRYDPRRSDTSGDGTPAAETDGSTRASQAGMTDDPAQAAKRKRIEILAQRARQIAHVEKAFVKAATVMKNLHRNLQARPKETLEEVDGLIGEMVTVFLNSTDVTLHVMGDKVGGDEVYYHSLNVTILTMMLAKELGFTTRAARQMGVGAMLHDIGLSGIPSQVLMKSQDEYSSAERQLRAMHVNYGVEVGRRLGLSPEALAIIEQHHEMCDGSGYPNALKEAQMTPEARLVSLVNCYDNLCNPVDSAKALTPHEALSSIFSQRRSNFEGRALQLMIRSLGVYPPGSIVQLSNKALASVFSINPKNPLRPWVLVYDAEVPKEEAIMLDLEQEPEITIVKSMRPDVLPPKVMAYLNPRKRITYFFDGGADAAARPKGA
ncbi:MAG: DUF3391 domain-containing protein [Betaproteobacteria bacterium]|nr:DUF3391 domain-containing protein [Betaproteobacteria bacterium]